jgi:hypothetical protein
MVLSYFCRDDRVNTAATPAHFKEPADRGDASHSKAPGHAIQIFLAEAHTIIIQKISVNKI